LLAADCDLARPALPSWSCGQAADAAAGQSRTSQSAKKAANARRKPCRSLLSVSQSRCSIVLRLLRPRNRNASWRSMNTILVQRALKGDRSTHSKTARDAGSSISVEMSGRSDVVLRDRAGNILFAVDSAARATTIGKQSGGGVPVLKTYPPTEMDLLSGCEGAFSPYAEPSKARIIGRCMSGIFSQAETVS
jgi:hypothetical protein